MEARIYHLDDVDRPEEVASILTDLEQRIVNEVTALRTELKDCVRRKPEKGHRKGLVMKKLLVVCALIGALVFAAIPLFAQYTRSDINYEIASNPELLSQYLRDVLSGQNYWRFTPTDTVPAGSDLLEGVVYYNDTANNLRLYNGTTWDTLDLSGGVTLDGAYDQGGSGSGRTINATDGAVHITSTDADSAFLFTLNAAPGSSAALGGMELTAGANSTESVIEIENSGSGYDFEGTAGGYLTKAGDWVMAGTTPTITMGDGGTEDTQINFDGNAQDFAIGLDDSADDLVICMDTSLGTTNIIAITDTPTNITFHDASAADAQLNFDGNAEDFYIALDDSADDLVIGRGTTVGTDIRLSILDGAAVQHIKIGDAAEEDMLLSWDGNAQDFSIGIDDTDDSLNFCLGTTMGTTERFKISSSALNIIFGDATTADVYNTFDGNAEDFYYGIDDSADDFVIGRGTTVGTDIRLSILDGAAVQHIKIGDAAAEDMILSWDGNAQDFSIRLDDSADALEIGFGTTAETDERITIDGSPTETIITIGDAATEDMRIEWDGNAANYHLALDDSSDDFIIGRGSTIATTEYLTFLNDSFIITVGDASTADSGFLFDGNAQDFVLGIDDSADDFVLSMDSALGTTNIIAITDTPTDITFHDASAADAVLRFDGNAEDFMLGLDDSTDDFVIGRGASFGTADSRLTILNGADTTTVVIGDAAEFDQIIAFDGNAQDYHIGLDDTDDDLKIGLGQTPGTTPAITIAETQVVSFPQTIVMSGGQTRSHLIHVSDVTLDSANPPTLTFNGTAAQWEFASLEFDANPNATGDDLCFITWVVPAGYVADSGDLHVYWSHDTAEDAADECVIDGTVNAVAAGEALDAAGTAMAAVTSVIADASASAGTLIKTSLDIEVEDIAVGDVVTICFWFDESACLMAASGTADVHYFEITYESTE